MKTQYDMGCIIPLTLVIVVTILYFCIEIFLAPASYWHYRHHARGLNNPCDTNCRFMENVKCGDSNCGGCNGH